MRPHCSDVGGGRVKWCSGSENSLAGGEIFHFPKHPHQPENSSSPERPCHSSGTLESARNTCPNPLEGARLAVRTPFRDAGSKGHTNMTTLGPQK